MNLTRSVRTVFAGIGLSAIAMTGCASQYVSPESAKRALDIPSWMPNESVVWLDGGYYMRKLEYNNLILFNGGKKIKEYMEKHKVSEEGVYERMDTNGDKAITGKEIDTFLRKLQ